MMTIDIAKIKIKPALSMQFSVQDEVDVSLHGYSEFVLRSPLIAMGKVTNLGDGDFGVTGNYSVEAELVCGRCTNPYVTTFAAAFETRFSTHPQSTPEDEESVWLVDGDCIELTPVILSEISFNLPMQPLCREDCRGLCPVCGVDLNEHSCSCAEDIIDPRWEKLKNFKFDN